MKAEIERGRADMAIEDVSGNFAMRRVLAGFRQQYSASAFSRQSIGEHTSSRPTADYDEIVMHSRPLPPASFLSRRVQGQ
jgi:hypothetical protein